MRACMRAGVCVSDIRVHIHVYRYYNSFLVNMCTINIKYK